MSEVLKKSHDKPKVDLDDVDLLDQYSWYINTNGYWRAYVRGSGRKARKFVYLHQLIGARIGISRVDHIDRDKENNARINLREATQQQNTFNGQLSKNNTSGFIGVSRVSEKTKTPRRWHAYITLNDKQIFLGHFSSPEQAALVRDKKAIELFGDYAALNHKESNV